MQKNNPYPIKKYGIGDKMAKENYNRPSIILLALSMAELSSDAR